MRDACPYQQSFTKDLRMSCVESEEILKTVEKMIIGDIYDLVMGKNMWCVARFGSICTI